MNKLLFSNLFIVLLLVFQNLTYGQVIKDFKPQWDSISGLKNPHKGWYHHTLDNGIAKYLIKNDSSFKAFPGMDHLYLRLAWSYLEPQEGKYDWHYLDEYIEK